MHVYVCVCVYVGVCMCVCVSVLPVLSLNLTCFLPPSHSLYVTVGASFLFLVFHC